MCLCQHGTEGRNCESCLPDHWDRPWRRATTENAWECRGKHFKERKENTNTAEYILNPVHSIF